MSGRIVGRQGGQIRRGIVPGWANSTGEDRDASLGPTEPTAREKRMERNARRDARRSQRRGIRS